MGKYDKYVIQRPFEHAEKGAKVWFKGDVDFGGSDFSIVFMVIDHDIVMEEASHSHDFDMWVWHMPLDPNNMEDLGCEIEYYLGAGTADDPVEKYTLTKTNCVYVPAGVVHGPHYFKNVTSPVLFVHAMRKGNYYKSEVFDAPKKGEYGDKRKYDKLIIENPIDYGEKRYYPVGYWGPNVWYKGDVDFGGNKFTLMFIRVEHDMAMEEDSHTHDFDMWVWHMPLDPSNIEELGGETVYHFGSGEEGDPVETYVINKPSCVFVPAGTRHGPHIFRNIKKPMLFVHAMIQDDYYKTEVFPDK